MLDIKRIRSNFEEVKEQLLKRHGDFGIDHVIDLDEKRRNLLVKVEDMKARQNKMSKEIPKLKKEGKDTKELLEEMKSLSGKVKELDGEVKEIDIELHDALLRIPNIPNEKVSVGKTDEDNVELRKWGEPTEFSFEPKAHWDLGVDLDIFDFERASKITGARFTLFKDKGALLERADRKSVV